MNSMTLYTKTSPPRLFFIVAVPGIISMFVSSLWGLFEGIMVAQCVGKMAFAAVNIGIPIVFINFCLADLIGVGSSVPISILLGKKDEDGANNYFTCSCILIFLTGIFMGVFLCTTAPILVKLMGASGELAELATLYIRIYAVCSPFTTITFALDNYLRICGKIKTSLFVNVAMTIIIAILLVVFLPVLGYGVGGAAFAVSLGMAVCAIAALLPFALGKLQLKFCKPHFRLQMVKQIISSGSPIFLSNVASRLTAILMNIVLLKIGGAAAVSVYGVLVYTGEVMQPILYGACDSLQPAIGYNYGAGNKKRVRAIGTCGLISCAVISIIGGAFIYLFPDIIAPLFLHNSDKELLSLCCHALQLFSITYLTRWFGFAIQSFLIAIDKSGPAAMLSVTNAFLFPVILLVVLWPMGLNGLWLNMPVTSLMVSILAGIFLYRLKGKIFYKQAEDSNLIT